MLKRLAFALLIALSLTTSAAALNLQPYSLLYAWPVRGTPALVPGASVTVYVAGTSTVANIYDASGTPISNPLLADANGFVLFFADAAGQYQVTWSIGSYVSPAVQVPQQPINLFSGANTWAGTNSWTQPATLNNWSLSTASSDYTIGGGARVAFGSPGSSGYSTSTPDALDLGNDYSSSTIGLSNLKLWLYHGNSSSVAGFGYSGDGFDIFYNGLFIAWNFWTGASPTNIAQISAPTIPTNGFLNVSSTYSQALQVAGGVGVSGALNIGGALYASGSVTAKNLQAAAAAPTLSACGTSPSAASGSGNSGGQFTLGTGTVTACQVAFATLYSSAAYCSVTPASSYTGTYYLGPISGDPHQRGFVLILSTSAPGASFNYRCTGQ